jgi:LysR family cys regulon transcriptional activator
MTLKQLRFLREIVRQDLHLSRAAARLHTSQPGVSRQIQLLERELGVVILQRKRNRILGLTQPGQEIVRFAERLLREEDNILNFRENLKDECAGRLAIASNRTHARYTLPPAVAAFASDYPQVRLEFYQGHREDSFSRLEKGEVDVAIGTDCDASLPNVAQLPCSTFSRVVVTCADHPLLRARKPSLAQLASYPLILHGSRTEERWQAIANFASQNVKPNIVLRAVDADVSKAYVKLGLGIAILPDIALDPESDSSLRVIDASHLFEPETVYVGLNKKLFYRRYVFEFVTKLVPDLTRRRLERALAA